MPEMKTYKIGFYTFGLSNDFEGTMTEKLTSWINDGRAPIIERGTTKFAMRGLTKVGQTIKGYIGKLRYDDLPHASTPGGDERELDLADDEGLIEKNFFIYHTNHQVIVYQHQGHGSNYAQLGAYLSDAIGSTVSVSPIIQPEALARLMRHDVEPKMVELSIGRPSAVFIPETQLSRDILQVMDSSDGMRIHLRISLGRTGGGVFTKLADGVKETVSELLESGHVSVAKFHVSEHGDTHPIDLITDRILGEARVELDGRYPVEDHIYRALNYVWNEHRQIVLTSIGNGNHALV